MKTSTIYTVVFVIGMLAIGIAGYNLYDYLTNPKKPHAPIGYDITNRVASWGLIWSNGLDRPWGVCRDTNGKLEQYSIKYPDKNK